MEADGRKVGGMDGTTIERVGLDGRTYRSFTEHARRYGITQFERDAIELGPEAAFRLNAGRAYGKGC